MSQTDKTLKKPNHLINETSTYLLQHAYNEVNWYPWGNEALNLAKTQNKPIFLSIGYSACHWCHVMEHESFNDPQIAKIMNDNFINIKVDREERPDLDEIYMKAVQIISHHGGWPMSVFLTTDLKPFFGGTYFPPEDSHSLPSFKKVLNTLAKLYHESIDDINNSASEIIALMQSMDNWQTESNAKIDFELILNKFLTNADMLYGGFGSQPKFPNPGNLLFLLNLSLKIDSEKLKLFLQTTLDKMAIGGIFDQLGGGFARYATDNKWHIPHFEKMLYDNAQLAYIYLKGYLIYNNKFYLEIARKTLDFVLTNLKDSSGGILSSLDADTIEGEGHYYVFTIAEIKSLLNKDEFDFINKIYDLKDTGNFEHQKNILYLKANPENLCSALALSMTDFKEKLATVNQKLFDYRQQRPIPSIDQKIITSWNCLMVVSLVYAYNITKNIDYLENAKSITDFILAKLVLNGNVMHSIAQNKTSIYGFLDDWSYLVMALLELAQTVPEAKYLNLAIDFTNKIMTQFSADNDFYFTSNNQAENLIIRPKHIYDTVYPSGLSVLVANFLKLFQFTNYQPYQDLALGIIDKYQGQIVEIPQQWGYMLNAILAKDNACLILLANPENDSYNDFMTTIYQKYLADKNMLILTPAMLNEFLTRQEFSQCLSLQNKELVQGKTTLYYCENYTCKEPINDLSKLQNFSFKE